MEKSALFSVGDRVVLSSGDRQRQHGRVTAIRNDRSYLVSMDLVDRGQFRWVTANELTLEASLPLQRLLRRAACHRNELEPMHTCAVSFILDAMRFLVCVEYGADQSVKGIADMKRLQATKLHSINTFGWSHWSPGFNQFRTSSQSVFSTLQRYLVDDFPRQETTLPEYYPLVLRALQDPAATAGWCTRITATFWVMGKGSDGTGIYLIPDANHATVYKVLHANGVAALLETYDRPILLKLTLLSWFGRIITDGIVSGTSRPGPPIKIQVADEALTTNLRETLRNSIEQLWYVDRLRVLEFEQRSVPYHNGANAPSQSSSFHANDYVVLTRANNQFTSLTNSNKIGYEYLNLALDEKGNSTMSLSSSSGSSRECPLKEQTLSFHERHSRLSNSALDNGDSERAITVQEPTKKEIKTRDSTKKKDGTRTQEPMSPKESRLVYVLSQLDPYPIDDCWVVMRDGDNYVLLGVQVGQRMLSFKKGQEKEPTAAQVLKAVYSATDVWRPQLLFVDSKATRDRLVWLTKDIMDFHVEYVSPNVLKKERVKYMQSIAKRVIQQCQIQK